MTIKAATAFGFERDGKVVSVRAGEEIDIPEDLVPLFRTRGFISDSVPEKAARRPAPATASD